ncbi:unnamed protein product [Dovyalis caffra]|uniref:Uncharacterized protein n=1 Tax=Dovyalis caffra TaxID=77055 RepID=A0AAV1R2F2_9ROSI|nr:unnamed protein product [Dovyalis caffra]
MSILKIQSLKPQFPSTFQTVPRHSLSHALKFSFRYSTSDSSSSSSSILSPLTSIRPTFKIFTVSSIGAPFFDNYKGEREEERNAATNLAEFEDLAPDGVVYQNTLRLVECSMFASVTGLVYFLSNSLSIENYFGCFFSLPIVISSLRWGVAGGRKTVVATAMLLFVLSGPVKTLTYLDGSQLGSFDFLVHHCSGNWCRGITINIHASLTFIFAATGINTVPSMNFIYALFSILVVLNSGFFVFLLHLLYSVFLTRLGMKDSLRLPRWLEKAL